MQLSENGTRPRIHRTRLVRVRICRLAVTAVAAAAVVPAAPPAVCSAREIAEPAGGVTADPSEWRSAALARALQVAAEIPDPYRRAEVLASVARTQALIDAQAQADATIRLALAAAEEISQEEFKGWALHDIVEAQMAADDPIGARQTAERIAAPRPQGAAFALIAATQLRGGKVDRAKQTALQIRHTAARDHVLWQIAAVQLLREDRAAAWETAGLIRDRDYRARAYGDIAVRDVRAGDPAGAEAAIARVRRGDRAEVHGRVALALAEQGDMDGALASLSRLDDVLHRAIVQGRMAAEAAEAVGGRANREAIAAAVAAVEQARDRRHRKAGVLTQLARIQAAIGDPESARATLLLAARATAGLPAPVQRDEVHDQIARVELRIGDTESAFATALRIGDEVSRALLMRDLAAADAAFESGPAAVEHLPVQGDALLTSAAYFGVIGAQLNRADHAVARANVAIARETVASIDMRYRPAALAALSGALVTMGDLQEAWDTLQDAMRAAESIPAPDQRAEAHVRIANALNERLLFMGKPVNKE